MLRILFLFLLSFTVLSAQSAESIKALQNKQKKAKQRIELTDRLLKETQKNQKATVTKLNVLKKQIVERQNLISAITSELGIIEDELTRLEAEKTLLERRLAALKKEYAMLVYHAYYFKTVENQYLYVFSATSFSEGYRRMRYIQQYSEYRKSQAIHIQEVTIQYQKKMDELSNKQQTKAVVLKGKETEAAHLKVAQDTEKVMLNELSKKEKDLKKTLQAEQKKMNELNNKISNLIAQEIEASRKKEEEKARKKAEKEKKDEKKPSSSTTSTTSTSTKSTTSTSKTTATPKATATPSVSAQDLQLAATFEKNQGRLPWPAQGIITGKFGIHPHPALQYVTVDNKGIYIQSERGADAKAVFAGEVTQVFSIPGSNIAVIVKHGIYRTVYANLARTYVKVGDKVSTKQAVGSIFVDDQNSNKTELYFMMYKNTVLMNPELWLVR